jgi:hypothetical protein
LAFVFVFPFAAHFLARERPIAIVADCEPTIATLGGRTNVDDLRPADRLAHLSALRMRQLR